jgi:hypothetical protein
MIYKLTSSYTVIAKLFRDFREFNDGLILPAIEWIGEVMEDIGICGNTITKYEELTSENHRVEIPCGCVKINNLSHHNRPMSYSTGDFTEHHSFEDEDDEYRRHPAGFIVEPGWIKTDEESITFWISYEAHELDENGFLMIPDMYYFNEACLYYCIMKLIGLGYKHPAISFKDTKELYEQYVNKAVFKGSIPDKPKMIALINSWKRLIPITHPNSNFGKGYGEREHIDFHGGLY